MTYSYDRTGERVEDEAADKWNPTQPEPGDALRHAYAHGVELCRNALREARAKSRERKW